MFRFMDKYILLLIFPLIYLFYKKDNEERESLELSSLKILGRGISKRTIKHKIGRYLVLIAVISLIIAAARPQIVKRDMSLPQMGIDIVIALDISGSMDHNDFYPNRLEVAKDYLDEFIKERPYDRFALVLFAGEAYTRVPLTLDHELIRNTIKEVSFDDISVGNTAIGMALVTAANRLKDSTAESKLIIILTDGLNNAGSVDPLTAADMAANFGVKIYAIGIDESDEYMGLLLKKIASLTSGKFFPVDEPEALKTVVESINEMEKTYFFDQNYELSSEYAFFFINIGVLLILAAFIFDHFLFLKLP